MFGITSNVRAGAISGEPTPLFSFRRWTTQQALGLTLILTLLVGGSAVAAMHLAADRAEIARQQQQLAELTETHQAVQGQLQNLQAERDTLSADLTARTSERDSLSGQLSEARTQASQADQAVAREHARNTTLSGVLALDQQMFNELGLFLQEFNAVQQAVNRGDRTTAQVAYGRMMEHFNRLTELDRQRRAALANIDPTLTRDQGRQVPPAPPVSMAAVNAPLVAVAVSTGGQVVPSGGHQSPHPGRSV